MINVTSQYPAQTFMAPAQSNIIAQVNANNSGVPAIIFPKKYRRAAATTAPDGSGAAMSQIDVLINQSSTYSYSSLKDAQAGALEAAAYLGNEFYIELSPLAPTYYSILTWASNI